MKIELGKKHKNIVKELRKRFIEELVLVIPDLYKEFILEIDISQFALERVLAMRYIDNKQEPVIFTFKLLNKTERNYKSHNYLKPALIFLLQVLTIFLGSISGSFLLIKFVLQTSSFWPIYIYCCNIGSDTSWSQFLLLYPSQINLLIISPRFSGYQAQFILGGKSLQGQLRDVQDIETTYEIHSNASFPKQPWLQLIYYTVCLPYGCNFKR